MNHKISIAFVSLLLRPDMHVKIPLWLGNIAMDWSEKGGERSTLPPGVQTESSVIVKIHICNRPRLHKYGFTAYSIYRRIQHVSLFLAPIHSPGLYVVSLRPSL